MFNRGVALVPATLVAQRDTAVLESHGAILSAWHGGKLLEVRWFADDVEREDAFFGPPDPAASGPSDLEQAFESATTESRTLKAAPSNDELLALYSLYKQASNGDVTGERPSIMDVTGRAKFDAWASRKGTSREDAMRAYVELVTKLKAADAS